MFPAGLEPATFRVLGGRDNHYTTETVVSTRRSIKNLFAKKLPIILQYAPCVNLKRKFIGQHNQKFPTYTSFKTYDNSEAREAP